MSSSVFRKMVKVSIVGLSLFVVASLALGVYVYRIQSEETAIVKDITSPLQNISLEAWEKLAQKTFFFGHQSVGDDILLGLQVLVEGDSKVGVVQGSEPEKVKPGILLHEYVGVNAEPLTKIDAFSRFIDGGIGGKVDFAFIKLCYIDVDKNSNAKELFSSYQTTIDRLKNSYPDTQFVHLTMPLRSDSDTVLKRTVKRLLGRGVFSSNLVRNNYNQLLKENYGGIDPIFDIAYYESISAVTGRMSYAKVIKGRKILSLSEDNTYDGGHLNDEGKKWLAANLLAFLAGLE